MSVPDQDLMIRTVDLRVDYDSVTAVSDVNLNIARGEMFGLIGPNGAGKTSTINVLATLLEPTYGDVYVGGIDVLEHPREAHKLLGYMPDMPPVYEDLKVWEFLDLFAAAYFVPPAKRRERISEVLAVANLESKREALSGSLSRGMKQRLLLAKTFLHDPQVLLLDEPASGLDPLARIELRDMLKSLTAQGKTVLISSHILTELSEFCTSIGIMEKGRMIVSGRIEDVVAQMSPHKTVMVEVLGPWSAARAIIEEFDGVKEIETGDKGLTVTFDGTDEQVVALLAALVAREIKVKAFYERSMDVEDVFLKVGAREVS